MFSFVKRIIRQNAYVPLRNECLAIGRRVFKNKIIKLRSGDSFFRGIKLRGDYAFFGWELGEGSFFEKLQLEGFTIYEIGAHVGRHTAAFSRAVGEKGKVIAFEANPATAKRLKDSWQLTIVIMCGLVFMGLLIKQVALDW